MRRGRENYQDPKSLLKGINNLSAPDRGLCKVIKGILLS
jgi:hypothetical protein